MPAACPICNKPVSESHKPFCSQRCMQVDLGKWLKGSYSVPVVEMDDLPDDLPDEEKSGY